MFKQFSYNNCIRFLKTCVEIINVSKQYAHKVVMHRKGVIEIGQKIGIPKIWLLQHDILKYLPHSLILNGIYRDATRLKKYPLTAKLIKYPLIAKLIKIQKKIHVKINPHHSQFVLWNIPVVKKMYGGIFMPKIIAKEGAADVIQGIKEDYPQYIILHTLEDFLQSDIFKKEQANYPKLCPITKKWFNEAYSQYYGFSSNLVTHFTTPILAV